MATQTFRRHLIGKLAVLLLCATMTIGLASCAGSKDPNTAYQTEVNDPIEPFNRAVFGFNNIVDTVLISPAANLYTFLLPEFVRNSIQSFMRNLRSPLIIANNLLQGDLGDAGVATARFVINTTGGVLGLVDIASHHGLAYEPEDFGQTLAVWGFGEGFYLVLPIIGPSSLRDTTGLVVDTIADPVRIVTHNTDNDWIFYTRGAIEGLDNRARLLKTVEDLRRNSLDYYAAVRSAYTQQRRALIEDQDPAAARDGQREINVPDYPDYYD